MTRKILITINENNVAPRFDLATEIWISSLAARGEETKEKTVVLPHASAEDLCRLILAEEVDTVICGGIEEEFFQYLNWKKITVFDSIIGPWARALERLQRNELKAGTVLYDR